MLDKDSLKSLYLQIEEDLEKKITSGLLKPGERIPTEDELVQEYMVSIITVRRAVSELCKKGLLDKQQGRGTFVRDTQFVRDSSSIMSFTESCRIQNMKAGARLLEAGIVPLDQKTAAALGLEHPCRGVFLSRLRLADGEPVVIEKNYFSLEYSFLLEHSFNDSSLFAFLKENSGVSISRSDKDISLCYARSDEARLLKVSKETPLIMIRSTAYDQKGEPLYAGTQVMNGLRFSLRIRQGV
ncbi:MAG: GntR family transcriptional regulator [Firmicutes bacterium]|nr:GntR family transcriptional regulator [Bacillota bacterium]